VSEKDIPNFNRYTITAALPYANGPVHIGHLAGVYIPADIYSRYLKLQGKDAKFICGSDEHGVAITMRARKEGITPQEVIDKYHTLIRDSFEQFGIKFDVYSRTSASIHHQTASEFFTDLYNKGVFTEETSEQFFDEQEQQFLADRYIQGTCPRCGFENAYGDQCENCGSTLSPEELINPRSMLSGAVPVKKETQHWYLPLDRYEGWLKEYIIEGHTDWKNNVYGQCKSWIDSGLKPRAVTRDLDWGVPVPLENTAGKVLYVWFDAPIGYISATRELAEKEGFDWKDYWCKPDTQLIHFIGKDNIVFHCIIFPTMLKAHGEFIWANQVPANEFLNLEGNKISTSRNWAVWLHEYLVDFPEKQDVLRYVLTANAPETKDNDFTWKDFQARNNNELVAILGNFVNRALVLTHKYFEGKVPELGSLGTLEVQAFEAIKAIPTSVEESLNQYRFREALANAMELARIGNKYLAETEPWKLAASDIEKTGTILNIALQICAKLAVLLEPFLPFTSDKLAAMLNFKKEGWQSLSAESLLIAGHQLNAPALLFNKIEDAEIEAQVAKLNATKEANAAAEKQPMPLKESVTFDDFGKMDIRVATIVAAEIVPKTKKLLKLTLETGIDTRTVVSGIAEHFKPEEIIGKQVCLLANLAPREIKNITSQGMILMAEDQNGKLQFVQPGNAVWNGATVN